MRQDEQDVQDEMSILIILCILSKSFWPPTWMCRGAVPGQANWSDRFELVDQVN
jgi:hypothetical protein